MVGFNPRLTGLLVLCTAALILILLFFNDVSFIQTRIHISDGILDDNRPVRPPRPPYPPFSPPEFDIDGPPPSKPGSHWGEDVTTGKGGKDDGLWTSREEAVKQSFLHAYHGYEEYAFPADELRPLANNSVQNFNGWGVTMVDALDTMLVMGLHDEFDRAIQHISTVNFTMDEGKFAPFFETVIRYLGGFLSAYALSGETILLTRADELGAKLLPAFDTKSGLPVYGVNTQTKAKHWGGTVLLAEMASCQMEYKYLAHLTGREEYFKTSDKVMDVMLKTRNAVHGMWPTTFNTDSGTPVNDVYTVGALADSAYEYLLKQYILSNYTEHRLAEMYMTSMNGAIENLVYVSPTRNLVYVTDTYYGMRPTRKFEHLACFFPGLLALGVHTLPKSVMSDKDRELHLWAAEAIGHSCWVMYADRTSGLGPETVVFKEWNEDQIAAWKAGDSNGHNAAIEDELDELEMKKGSENKEEPEKWLRHVERWEALGRKGKPPGVADADGPWHGKQPENKSKDYFESHDSYLLRPETLESMFVLWRTTGDSKWRDRGWEIWSAIESQTRTGSGYASQNSVSGVKPIPDESLPSYFFAETIKYAYLLTRPDDPFSESEYVFNTEAHPLPIFEWKDWQKKKWSIST